MSGSDKLTARRGHIPVASLVLVIALMCSAAGAGEDGNHGDRPKPPSGAPTGTIRYPCGDPALTRRGLTPNGTCGYMFNVTGGDHYTVHPWKPADLDIYFYKGTGSDFTANPGRLGSCGDLSGDVPGDSVTAVVVVSPSNCSAESVAVDGSQMNVKFDYTSS